MKQKYDVAVVGGGIVGLAHAWMAARRGLSVVLFERDGRAEGATIRNFGMVWPIGQPAGERYELALQSRGFWLELEQAGVVAASRCGAIHLAHQDDELAVLEEFAALGTHQCEVLSIDQTRKAAPVANPDGLKGGLFSPTELRVDPRIAADSIATWLQQHHGVKRRCATPVIHVEQGQVTPAHGDSCCAQKIIICSGSDFETLFQDVFANSGLQRCKLQMLRSVAQDASINQFSHLASGLTLRHYTSFQACPSLPALRNRFAMQNPALDRYGIHVMATQAANGEFIFGDSHEYDDQISPFDNVQIDELILEELKKVICLPDWRILQRWHGIYAKHPLLPIFEAEPLPGVHVCVGPGGAGMTMSFGLANRAWQNWA